MAKIVLRTKREYNAFIASEIRWGGGKGLAVSESNITVYQSIASI